MNTSFDETQISLCVGVLSDVHSSVSDQGQSRQKLCRAFDCLRAGWGDRLDAVLFPGDLTDHGSDEEMLALTQALRPYRSSRYRMLFTMGNHDLWMNNPAHFEQQLADFQQDGDDERNEFYDRHAVIGGYHFLFPLAPEYIFEDAVCYRPETLTWLDNALRQCTAAQPERYVFVVIHPGIEGTTYLAAGSFWASKDIRDVLKKYPQVLAITGHMHIAQQHEQGIWQQEYTVTGCGSVSYCTINNIYAQTRKTTFHPRAWESSQGSVYEVDCHGAVRITKLNFSEWQPDRPAAALLKQPWLLDAPRRDNAHLTRYQPERFASCPCPVFPAHSTARVAASKDGALLCLPAAADADFVMHYHVVAERAGAKVFDDCFVTDYFLSSQPARTNGSVSLCLGGYQPRFGDVLRVTAVNSFGKTSAPLQQTLNFQEIGSTDMYDAILHSEAEFIQSIQLSNGAIPMYGHPPEGMAGQNKVMPYFSSFAALAVLQVEGYQEVAKQYIDWHLGHLNPKDINGLAGTIYDYSIDNATLVEVPSMDYDSTDSYAAIFLELLYRYYQTTGDTRFFADKKEVVTGIAAAMTATMEHGLTWAKPTWLQKYTMDNAEVYVGMGAAAKLFGEIYGDAVLCDQWRNAQTALKQQMEAQLYSEGTGKYFSSTSPQGPVPTDWGKFYADAACQLYPATFGVIDPAGERAKALYTAFNQHQGGWETLCGQTGSFPWAVICYAAAIMGDDARVNLYLSTVKERFMDTGHPAPWYCFEAAMALNSAALMKKRTQ